MHGLHELIGEDYEVINNNPNINIYAIPIDGAETEEKSNDCDDEHEGNLDHLGGNMLRTTCEIGGNFAKDHDSKTEINIPLLSFKKQGQPPVEARREISNQESEDSDA